MGDTIVVYNKIPQLRWAFALRDLITEFFKYLCAAVDAICSTYGTAMV